MRTHQEIDERSLALHRLIAEKIRRDPQLFTRAKETLARWRKSVCAASQPHLEDWERLLGLGVDACLNAAVEESERATALRQTSPFAGLLSNQERFAFLKSWNRTHAPRRT